MPTTPQRKFGWWSAFLRYFIPLALATVGILILFARLDTRHQVELLKSREVAENRIVQQRMERELEQVKADLQTLGELPAFRELVEAPSPDAEARMLLACAAFSRWHKAYDHVRFLDAKGMERIRINLQGDETVAIPKEKLNYKGDRDYFLDAIRLERGGVFISALELNMFREAKEAIKPRICFSTPIVDARRNKVGVLVINFVADGLLSWLNQGSSLGDSSTSELLNAQGYWLHAVDPANEWAFMYGKEQSFARSFPREWGQIAAQESGQFRSAEGLFTFHTVRMPVPGPAYADHFWKLVSRVTNQELGRFDWVQRREFWLVAASLLGLMALVSAGLATANLRRRQAEAAVRSSEENLAITLHSIGDGVIATDGLGRITRMNATAERLTGWTLEAAASRPLGDVFHIVDALTREPAQDPVAKVLAHGEVVGLANHTALLSRDGAEYQIADSAAPIRDASGAMVGVVLVFSDVTEQYRVQAALAEREERYRTFFTHGPDGIVVLDPATARPLEFNDQACRQLGYTREEFGRLTMADIEASETFAETARRIQKVLTEGHDDFETLQRTKQGELRNIHVTAQFIQAQGTSTYHCVWRDITERKRAVEELVEAHQFNSLIVQGAQEGIIVYGPDLRYRVWNPYMEQMSGVPAGEVLGRHPLEVFPFLRETGLLERLEAVLRGEGVPAYDFPYRVSATGKAGWTTDTSAPMRNAKGEIIGVIGTVSEITERKLGEVMLRDSKACLQRAEQVAHFGNWELSLADRIIHASEGAREIYGLQGEVWPLAEVQALCLPAYRRMLDEAFVNMLANGRPYSVEFRIRRSNDGQERDIHSMAEYDRDRGILFGVISDITERKHAEKTLKQKKDLLAQTESIAHVGSWEWEADTGTVTWSEEMFRIFQRDLSYGAPSFAEQEGIYHAEDMAKLKRAVELALRDFTPYELELRALRSDGETRVCMARGVAEKGPDGKVHRLFGSLQDITLSKRSEEETVKLQAQLQQSQKMESLGTLAGGVAHDMNNVLGAILGMATASIGAQPADSPAYRAFDTIIQAASRGGKMVKSLLGFARQSPAEEHELDMNEILREEIRMLERTTLAKVRLEMDLAAALRPIRGDASALTHAVMNLCVNAVDAMPEDGTLTLRTRNLGNDWIEVIVEDTGTGMPKEVLEKALDPFFTTKEQGKGTGLGLSMVYSTVKAHQGQMEIQSELGKGTRVWMRLPACVSVTQIPEPQAERRSESSLGALSVLIVDDDDLIQSATQAVLDVLGHSVTSASRGEEALAQLEAGLNPDVVILDMNMPGLGGPGTLPRLRALRPTVPVLLATGRVDQTAMNLAGAHPQVTLLSKPFSLGELRKYLESVPRA